MANKLPGVVNVDPLNEDDRRGFCKHLQPEGFSQCANPLITQANNEIWNLTAEQIDEGQWIIITGF